MSPEQHHVERWIFDESTHTFLKQVSKTSAQMQYPVVFEITDEYRYRTHKVCFKYNTPTDRTDWMS